MKNTIKILKEDKMKIIKVIILGGILISAYILYILQQTQEIPFIYNQF